MTDPTAVLLFAAGLGTRMAPLTDDRPKPLIYVAGRALIDHALSHCDGLRKVANVHYRADMIRAHLSHQDVLISDETEKLLETGGGLRHALPLLDGNPVYTLNTDAVWTDTTALTTLAKAWRPDRMEALLLLVPTSHAVGHAGAGDFDMDTDGRITTGPGYVYTGAQIIRTDGLTEIEEGVFSMWALWKEMLARGTMFGIRYGGGWCDVGRPENIALAEDMLEGRDDV